MKFEIELKGEKTTVEIKMLGKHTRQIGKYIKELVEKTQENDQDLSLAEEHAEKIWSIVCDLTGLKQEDYDEIPVEDSKKLTDYVQNSWKGRIDFMNAL